MYDIKHLEDEWSRYKKKKMKPWYILIASLLLVAIVTILFFNYKDVITSKFSTKDSNKTITTVEKSKSTILLDEALTRLEVNEKPIEDLMPKNKSVKKEIVVERKSNEVTQVDDPMRYQHPNAKKVLITVTEPVKKAVVVEKPRKRKHLKIIQTSGSKAYRDVEKRFKDTKDVDDSLFLARTYYNKGNNKKAIYWALQTNKINSNIEESWLIFAKAKARSGRKDEAIRILSSYIKRSNSYSAKALLNKYKK
jgi:tetratricopeptide (TPR) repeat protein